MVEGEKHNDVKSCIHHIHSDGKNEMSKKVFELCSNDWMNAWCLLDNTW